MNLAELYSLQSGVKLNKPELLDKYYPLPFSKYITFSPYSKNSKNYSWFQEVLDILFPVLRKNDIHVLQIGAAGEVGFLGCVNIQGTCTIQQSFYLIKNALLHLGCDSYSAHTAGVYDINRVIIFGNNFSKNTGPYFGSKEKQILIDPPRKEGESPTFCLDEPYPKQIDRIKPEIIAESVLKLLNLDFSFPYQSLYFGPNYNTRMIENIPNHVIDINGLGISNLIIRMDLHYDEQNLERQLQNCRCGIVTNKPISLDLINKYKGNIVEVVYVLDESHSLDFAKFVYYSGTSLVMLSRLSEEKVNELKLIYMEYGIIWRKTGGKIEEIEGKDEVYYKSNSFLLSDGKIYQSEYDYLNNRSIPKLESTLQLVIKGDNFDLFGRDKDRFYFLEKK